MTTPISVSENDLHAMLQMVKSPDGNDDGDLLPWSTLQRLQDLIPSTHILFGGMEARRELHYAGQCIGKERLGIGSDGEAIFWAHYWDSLHCSYADRTGDLRSVVMVADFSTLRAFRQTALYTEFFRLNDDQDSIHLNLPDGPGRTLRMIFFRGSGDPEFTERDRALLVLLRPHLHAAHVEVFRRRRGIPPLTPRQWELLRLVDGGLSNRQIAHCMNVSEHTVRKHLENIFERLQVTSRTAALARAFPERAIVSH